MSPLLILLLLLSALLCPVYPQRAISFDDFISLDAVSDPQISPDGKWVVFVVTDHSLQENRGNSDLWIIPLAGGTARQLTSSAKTDNQPRWSPDGRYIAFFSTREGGPGVFIIAADGGEARKIADAQGISNLAWSPDGQSLVYSSDVAWPVPAKDEDPFPTEVKIWEHLFYRHWDEWREGKRSHLFLIPRTGGKARDFTPHDYDFPTLALGGFHDVSFTPDGKQIAVVTNLDPVPAVGTNNDIVLISIEDGAQRNLTLSNRANDNNPRFSPGGNQIAYRAQVRPGFESDRHHLMIMDLQTGSNRDLTADWDLSVGELFWSPDQNFIFTLVEERGNNVPYRISLQDSKRERLMEGGYQQGLALSPDGKTLVFSRQQAHQPPELFAFDLNNRSLRKISHINDELMSHLVMNPLESFQFKGALGDTVHGYLLKPPQFDPARKYPLVYLIHGGPQSAWEDMFHPRWNYQMFAAPGYVVAMINFHGSTGYGQEFTDSISQHWGDYPFEDVMKGLDHLLDNYRFIDSAKVAAAGASYGGYMINWIAGHTDRFTCLINHDGVFNMVSMYGETDELWFPEWEFDGTPWTNQELYSRWSPHNYAGDFRTPLLVIHGQLDYRVDVSQGFETFTALKRQNVPARFVYFPDEGHWVLQPRNRRIWWREVHRWLEQYLKK
ncbi:MAG: S9 family peptidase [Acidobacteria bacterium]|nr:S9 family peptidase [Acidobacteriota bacterium]